MAQRQHIVLFSMFSLLTYMLFCPSTTVRLGPSASQVGVPSAQEVAQLLVSAWTNSRQSGALAVPRPAPTTPKANVAAPTPSPSNEENEKNEEKKDEGAASTVKDASSSCGKPKNPQQGEELENEEDCDDLDGTPLDEDDVTEPGCPPELETKLETKESLKKLTEGILAIFPKC